MESLIAPSCPIVPVAHVLIIIPDGIDAYLVPECMFTEEQNAFLERVRTHGNDWPLTNEVETGCPCAAGSEHRASCPLNPNVRLYVDTSDPRVRKVPFYATGSAKFGESVRISRVFLW